MRKGGPRISLITLLALAIYPSAIAQKADTKTNSQLTAAEQALVELMTDYEAEQDPWFDALRSYETSEAREEAIETGKIVDPGARYIPRLLAFESEHRGEEIGLLALWHVFGEAASTARFNDPASVGSREALTRLTHYEHSPLLPLVVGRALRWKPQEYESVQLLCNSPKISASTRDMLRYYLAVYSLKTRAARKYNVERVEILGAGGEPTWARELENHLAMLEAWPSANVLDERCVDAMRTLEELAKSSPSPRFPDVERVDEKWYIVRLSAESSELRVSEKAAGALFKERHLVIGAKAPDLDAPLLDGTTWRMADQVGKVVVLQFSFTGCGPCERMYPDLAKLTTQYPDDLEILTLMRDETPDSVLEGTKSGKFTWSIALDGKPGRVCTKWSVSRFPTIYVIDKNGKIAAQDVRGEALREEVARLVGERE